MVGLHEQKIWGLYQNITDKESRMSTLKNSLKSDKMHIRLGLG